MEHVPTSRRSERTEKEAVKADEEKEGQESEEKGTNFFIPFQTSVSKLQSMQIFGSSPAK